MSAIRLRGATSGTTDVVAAAIAGDGVMTLPTGTGTLATTASVTAAQADATAAGIAGGGLVAVAPTSIANSGGSASTTGNTTTFTGVTSLSLNGIFSATYRNYLMICNYSSSSDVYTEFRLRSSGTDATGSNYDRQLIQAYGGSLNASSNIDVSSWQFGWGLSTARSLVQSLVSNPFLAVATNITHIYTTQSEIGTNGGDHDLATSYDGFTIYPISGNFTGTIQVFGYKD